jgi:hypothetical protein
MNFFSKGLYDTDYGFYGRQAARLTAMVVVVLMLVLSPPPAILLRSPWLCTTVAALLLGLFWQQLAFVVHDLFVLLQLLLRPFSP